MRHRRTASFDTAHDTGREGLGTCPGRGRPAALLACALAVVVAAGGCAGDAPAPQSPAPPPARTPGTLLELSRNAQAGSEVFMAIQFIASDDVTLEFNTTQRFDFVVTDCAGDKVWQYSDDRAFGQVLSRDDLRAGEGRRYEASWTPEAPGAFEVEGRITAANKPVSKKGELAVSPPGAAPPAPCP